MHSLTLRRCEGMCRVGERPARGEFGQGHEEQVLGGGRTMQCDKRQRTSPAAVEVAWKAAPPQRLLAPLGHSLLCEAQTREGRMPPDAWVTAAGAPPNGKNPHPSP